MSGRASSYQEQITGHPATESYVVDGVKFDGFDPLAGQAGELQDAKGPGYAKFVKNGAFMPWFKGQDGLVRQAQRQLAVANGTPIVWYVAEDGAVEAIQSQLATSGINGIEIVHVSPNG